MDPTDASSNGNVKLRDIATSLVESVGGTASGHPLRGTRPEGSRPTGTGNVCLWHPPAGDTLNEVEPLAIDTPFWSTYGPLDRPRQAGHRL